MFDELLEVILRSENMLEKAKRKFVIEQVGLLEDLVELNPTLISLFFYTHLSCYISIYLVEGVRPLN
jgi:hypothetical protein